MRLDVKSVAVTTSSPDQVWAIAGDFFAPWHPAIATMRAEPGQVRAFTVQGEDTTYRERLTYLSHCDRTYAYTHIEGIEGVYHYDARLSVQALDDGARITMSANLSAPAGRAEGIASGTKAIFDNGVATLAQLAESGAVTAKTASTFAKVSAETRVLANAPQIALSVTPERQGPLCLFLHGIGGAQSNWDAQLSVAGDITPAAALDLRGYGDSGLGPDQTNVEDYCADILRIKAVLGADKMILCGLSYGAWIATSFAMRHPDQLAGIILSGGCTGMSEAGEAERSAFRQAREAPLNAGQSPADFAPAVVNVIAGPNAGPDVRAALTASMSAIPTATYRDALTCFTNPPGIFDFTKLTMPVLMMTGEHDRLAPPAEIRAIANRIHDQSPCPDVQFEVIQGAGHVCNLEAPDAYNAHLIPFLSRLA